MDWHSCHRHCHHRRRSRLPGIRPSHVDAHPGTNPRAFGHRSPGNNRAGTNSNPVAHNGANSNVRTRANAHSAAHCHANSNANTNSRPNANTNATADTYPNPATDCHANASANPHAATNPNPGPTQPDYEFEQRQLVGTQPTYAGGPTSAIALDCRRR